MADGATMMRRPGATAVIDWIVNAVLAGLDAPVVMAGLAERVVRTGLQIDRVQLGTTTIHPQHQGLTVTWRRGQPLEVERYPHGSWNEETFQRSPFSAVLGGSMKDGFVSSRTDDMAEWDLTLHRRFLLEGPDLVTYPLLGELAGTGFTDYIACAVPFWREGRVGLPIRTGVLVSWATRAAGGFSEQDAEALVWLTPKLAVGVRNAMSEEIGRNILSTYLGTDAGERVMSGVVRQGDVETIEAAVLIADLRGFTTMADTVPADRLVAALGAYLACMVEPVTEHGGEVLKFLGDGVLAVFPQSTTGRGGRDAHVAAGEAARVALDRVAALNAERQAAGEVSLSLDIALHTGPVQYGNVGAGNRLDFTIIGPAVNEAARMEAMCAPLGVHLLASEAFVAASGAGDGYLELGRHALRGVAQPRLLFTRRDRSAQRIAAESA